VNSGSHYGGYMYWVCLGILFMVSVLVGMKIGETPNRH